MNSAKFKMIAGILFLMPLLAGISGNSQGAEKTDILAGRLMDRA